jgi:hypothetical protein
VVFPTWRGPNKATAGFSASACFTFVSSRRCIIYANVTLNIIFT